MVALDFCLQMQFKIHLLIYITIFGLGPAYLGNYLFKADMAIQLSSAEEISLMVPRFIFQETEAGSGGFGFFSPHLGSCKLELFLHGNPQEPI